MAPYAMYLRKSRKDLDLEQKGEGDTLARHKLILFDLAARMQIPIREEDIYKEVVSADTIAARPEMQRLLSDIESGMFEGVFVIEVERLARGDTIDQGIVAQTFKYTDTKIITPAKIYDPQNEADLEYFEFSLFMSRREYTTIKRRMTMGKRAAAREGRYVTNVPPFGYDRIKVPDSKGFTLAPNHEADTVRQIYDWYIGYPRLGTTNIAHRLNELGIPTRTGGLWTTATIQGILHNEVYIGKIRWGSRQRKKQIENGRVVVTRPRNNNYMLADGLHPAIISMDVWAQAQENLRNNRPAPVNLGKETKNPFAGLIVCGKCGRKMIRRTYKERQPASLMCPIAECDNVSSDLDIVEDRVIADLTGKLKAMTSVGQKPVKPPVVAMNAVRELTAELKALTAQQDQIRSLLERGVYDVATYQDRNQKIETSIAAVKQNLAAANNIVAEYDKAAEHANLIAPKLRSMLEIYWESSPARRNELLRAVVERIVYTRETSTKWKQRDAFSVEVFLR